MIPKPITLKIRLSYKQAVAILHQLEEALDVYTKGEEDEQQNK